MTHGRNSRYKSFLLVDFRFCAQMESYCQIILCACRVCQNNYIDRLFVLEEALVKPRDCH